MDGSQALARVPMFATVDRQRLRRLASGSAVRTYAAGQLVAAPTERATHLLVVESGALAGIHYGVDGRSIRLGHFPAPRVVDKAAVLDGGNHTATWQAVGATRLRRIPRADLLALLDDDPSVREHVLTHLAAQVREHQTERVRASLDDATTRVAAWLARAAAVHGDTVTLPDGQEGLGQAIGASRVTTNRALRVLARDALIHVHPGTVQVLSPDGLAHRAGLSL